MARDSSRSSWRGTVRDHRGGGAGTRLRRPPLATFEPTGTWAPRWDGSGAPLSLTARSTPPAPSARARRHPSRPRECSLTRTNLDTSAARTRRPGAPNKAVRRAPGGWGTRPAGAARPCRWLLTVRRYPADKTAMPTAEQFSSQQPLRARRPWDASPSPETPEASRSARVSPPRASWSRPPRARAADPGPA